MKIRVIRKENATEVCSFCTMETFLEKVKKETKGKYISQLREKLPSLQGSEMRFVHIDKIPRIYPVAEFVKSKAALLPQTFAALVGASGRSVKIWIRFLSYIDRDVSGGLATCARYFVDM